MPKLIVTNGDVAVERLKEADMSGQILPWQDMLHDGPVPSSDVLDEVSDIRATFLSEALGLPLDEVRANFARRDGVLDIHPAYAEVELWFEHDLYDQLQLIQLLHYFSNQPERMGLFLVQAQDYLGLLEVSDIRALGKSRKPVSQIQLETGRSAWEAFTAPTPTALAGFATTPHACLPYLAPAFRRLLAELPAPHSGLSLTEERILQQLLEGPRKVAHVFAAVNAMDEDAQFLADLPFSSALTDWPSRTSLWSPACPSAAMSVAAWRLSKVRKVRRKWLIAPMRVRKSPSLRRGLPHCGASSIMPARTA